MRAHPPGPNWCAARVDLHLDHRHVISSAGVFFRGEWRVESPRDPLHRELFTNFAPTLSNIIKVHQFNVCPIHNSLIIPIRLPLCGTVPTVICHDYTLWAASSSGAFFSESEIRRLGRDGSISRTALITRWQFLIEAFTTGSGEKVRRRILRTTPERGVAIYLY